MSALQDPLSIFSQAHSGPYVLKHAANTYASRRRDGADSRKQSLVRVRGGREDRRVGVGIAGEVER